MLRNDTPSRDVVLDGDDEPIDGAPRGPRRHGPVDRDLDVAAPAAARLRHATGVQLRAMATAPDVRGQGAGDALLDAGIARARAAEPNAVVWARARDSALGFYRRHGFEVVEPGFVDEATTATRTT